MAFNPFFDKGEKLFDRKGGGFSTEKVRSFSTERSV